MGLQQEQGATCQLAAAKTTRLAAPLVTQPLGL